MLNHNADTLGLIAEALKMRYPTALSLVIAALCASGVVGAGDIIAIIRVVIAATDRARTRPSCTSTAAPPAGNEIPPVGPSTKAPPARSVPTPA